MQASASVSIELFSSQIALMHGTVVLLDPCVNAHPVYICHKHK